MAKKSNFGRAMYDMFGVGRDPEEDVPQEEVKAVKKEVEPELQEPERVIKSEPVETEVVVEDTPVYMDMGNTYSPQPVRSQVPVVYAKSFFAEGTTIEGTITTKGDIEIAGQFSGNIMSEGKVTVMSSFDGNITARDICIIGSEITGDLIATGLIEIDAGSALIGDLKAENVLCAGRVAGDLTIQENLTLTERAQIVGNSKMASMQVSRGAKIIGKVDMRR